ASAGRQSGIVGQRFLIGGVAVAALGTAVVTQMIARMPLSGAQEATVWTVGSLSGASAERIAWLGIALLVLLPLGGWLHAALRPSSVPNSPWASAPGPSPPGPPRLAWARSSPPSRRRWPAPCRSSPCCRPPSPPPWGVAA